MHELNNYNQSDITTGSCSTANRSNCYVLGSCKGEPPNCYCDSLCCLFDDCCSDATESMCPRSRPACSDTEQGVPSTKKYHKLLILT